jgi:hypothetical protein
MKSVDRLRMVVRDNYEREFDPNLHIYDVGTFYFSQETKASLKMTCRECSTKLP